MELKGNMPINGIKNGATSLTARLAREELQRRGVQLRPLSEVMQMTMDSIGNRTPVDLDAMRQRSVANQEEKMDKLLNVPKQAFNTFTDYLNK